MSAGSSCYGRSRPASLGSVNSVDSLALGPVPSFPAEPVTAPSGASPSASSLPTAVSQPTMQLASPLSVPPQHGPDITWFYAVLLAAGLVMTAGTRLVAAVGVKLGFWAAYGMPVESPVSALRLPSH